MKAPILEKKGGDFSADIANYQTSLFGIILKTLVS